MLDPLEQRLGHDHALHLDRAGRDGGRLGVAPVVLDGAVERGARAGLDRLVLHRLEQHLGHRLVALGDRDAGRRGEHVGELAGGLGVDGAVGEQAGHPHLHQRARPLGVERRRQVVPVRRQLLAERRQQPLAAGVARDADPLVGERLADDGPALADAAEHGVGPGPHVVEEHLVEVVGAEHRPDRPHGDAGRVHRDDEHRDALVPLAGADPGGEHAPLRHAGVGGPDLLAGDAVAVAVLDGAGAQRGQVGAGLGLAEALAPDHLAGRDGREVLLPSGRRCRRP